MRITQIRNATVLLEFQTTTGAVGLLVDPMLAARGALPALKYFGGTRRRNPLVDLPPAAPQLLERVTHGLITHCQRGHFDHLDRAGKSFLRKAQLPVFCMPRDRAYLERRGIQARALQGEGRQPFFNGSITPVRCLHGQGLVGRMMEHGFGYLIELPGEPSVYVAGDTLLTADVEACLRSSKPAVSVLPAGGARFDLGGEILMDGEDVLAACGMTPRVVVANHLEALDHCPTTRASLRQLAARAGLQGRLLVPNDGECMEFAA